MFDRTKRDRGAFTLVELLVVIAIIGILVALLLPAVQAAREAGRRMSCGNNLKQIALAAHNYHDTYRSFPAGGVSYGPCCGVPNYQTWTISLLPYLESTTMQEQYNFDVPNEDGLNQFVREQILPVFVCPSDINTKITDRPASGPGSGLQYAPGSYRAVSGISDSSCWADNNQIGGANSICHRGRGVLHHVGTRGTHEESFADILDGTSSTLLVGEFHTRSRNRRRTFWAYTYTSYNQSSITVQQPRILLSDYDRCVAIGGTGGSNPCKRGFASLHPGAIQFALADGSVRGIVTTVNMDVLAALATISRQEVVTLPQ